jgi:hypothetical protein
MVAIYQAGHYHAAGGIEGAGEAGLSQIGPVDGQPGVNLIGGANPNNLVILGQQGAVINFCPPVIHSDQNRGVLYQQGCHGTRPFL